MIEPSDSLGVDPIEEVERRRADEEIYRVVRQAGFRGSLWRQLADELARYGCGVLEAWLVSGVIGGKVGACLYSFPNVLRRWQRSEDRWTSALAAMTAEVFSRENLLHPDRDVDVAMTVDALLASSGDREAAIVRLSMNGFTSVEIAHVLGGTSAGVRSVLQRWRTKAQLKLVDDEGADDESQH